MMNSIFDLMGAFRIQDLFDILIISTLIYVVLIWFKDTASRFVFAGISLLGVVYIVARIFHLYLTSLVLQGFFTILLIALVVIFQEDIRRFFERLATWGALRKARKFTGDRKWPVDIEVLIESIADLASRRVGAIIVLQGLDPLELGFKELLLRFFTKRFRFGGKTPTETAAPASTPAHSGAHASPKRHTSCTGAHAPSRTGSKAGRACLVKSWHMFCLA